MTPKENAKLARVEGEAAMGQLIRRFWLPFLLSTDLPEPDCDPVRVRLLGENRVAFRDTSGKVGLVDRLCAHRRADLFFGRNEENGLRCVYHGWKYGVTGQCMEAPTEPRDSDFTSKVRLRASSVVEQAGILWAYLGPPALIPELPDFEWMHVPESHRFVSWSTQDCNFVQAIEGGIDTVHSVYLHSTLDSHRRLEEWRTNGQGARSAVQARYRTRDNPPKVFAEETDYGLLIGGRYEGAQGGEDYWRYNLFLMPFYTMPPGAPDSKLCHAFVPLDDGTTARWSITWTLERPYAARDIATMRSGGGVHAALIPGTHTPLRNRSNDYLNDRSEQRTLTFTGIRGTGEQDFAVQEGMGSIVDRSEEHLGITDVGIIQMRRRLLKEAADLEEGAEPHTAGHGNVYRVHAGESLLSTEVVNWAQDEKTKQALAAKW